MPVGHVEGGRERVGRQQGEDKERLRGPTPRGGHEWVCTKGGREGKGPAGRGSCDDGAPHVVNARKRCVYLYSLLSSLKGGRITVVRRADVPMQLSHFNFLKTGIVSTYKIASQFCTHARPLGRHMTCTRTAWHLTVSNKDCKVTTGIRGIETACVNMLPGALKCLQFRYFAAHVVKHPYGYPLLRKMCFLHRRRKVSLPCRPLNNMHDVH